ncbi:hypothetical protein BKA64DRAFT_251801 [Cadophora sp. MPI-SDFR-AT-0126]|nr:hypothetical protein BKA64DRAFT_251801 [Leotiomycetes sp. MPI-SDFR-AT-0126]
MSQSTKRGQKKSRKGCGICKIRKIKCDEEIPCRNCVKHRVECDFLTVAPSESPPGINSSLVGGSLPDLNLKDIELFHHYCTSTSQSMWTNPLLRIFWRIQVPHIGLTYQFVMRGILSMAALHMAYLNPNKKDVYLPYSMHHQQQAMKEVMEILPNVTTENCTALHLFSILNCCHILGRPREKEDFLIVGNSGISQWLVLFRGVLGFIEPYQDALDRGPLSAIISVRKQRQRERESCISQSKGDYLGDLRRHVLGSTMDEQHSKVYSDNINELEKSFIFIYTSTDYVYEMGDVFNYLMMSSHEYLLLLSDGTQQALTIFAYACVLFHKLEHFWWMEGWSHHLMNNIWQFLDQEHRQLVTWVVQEIGWSPPQTADA